MGTGITEKYKSSIKSGNGGTLALHSVLELAIIRAANWEGKLDGSWKRVKTSWNSQA